MNKSEFENFINNWISEIKNCTPSELNQLREDFINMRPDSDYCIPDEICIEAPTTHNKTKEKMIVIYAKSKMRKMPTCCEKCVYYKHSPIIKEFYNKDGVCTADGYLSSMYNVCVTKERPSWCPLIEREEHSDGKA